jgi:Rhodopirellula transposase DDE domain
LVSHQAIVNLIAATTTRTGLRVKAALDTRRYETARPVPDDVLVRLKITPHAFHGDWNYTIAPRH